MMFRLPDTLAARLTLWYAAIFAAFSATAFLLFYLVTNTALDLKIDADLVEDLEEFRILWSSNGRERVQEEIRREVTSDGSDEIFLRLLDTDGNELYSSDLSHWGNIDPGAKTAGRVSMEPEPLLETIRTGDGDYNARVISGLVAPGTILQIGESMEEKDDFLELLLNVFAACFVVVLVLAALAGWFMARQALRGVEEVSRAAEDVARGALDRRVSTGRRGEEIERLASAFNIMVDRVHKLVAGLREVTDNIAHDLRSPIARIRANSEMAVSNHRTTDEYCESAVEIMEECDRMMQMINTTLDVTEAEAGSSTTSDDRVDIARLLVDACELFEPVAEDRAIDFRLSPEPGGEVCGNTQQLQRMFANLLDNALKYTPENGQVGVSMVVDDKTVTVKVLDNGPGINESDQARIFNRSFRCDRSRSEPGFGLGLSLARAIARAHGGDITVSSKAGDGACFHVVLPRYNP